MQLWRHIRANIALPFNVCILIPAILLFITQQFFPAWQNQPSTFQSIAAVVTFLIGLFLLGMSIKPFFTFDNGTLAPFNPSKKLVVRGIYCHSRNPMISGVFLILLGEALFFGSSLLFGWFIFFIVAKLFYIHGHEHHEMLERFGASYIVYVRNVPAWIPRLTAWEQNSPSVTSIRLSTGTHPTVG